MAKLFNIIVYSHFYRTVVFHIGIFIYYFLTFEIFHLF